MSLRIVFVAPFGLRQKTTVWARTLPIAQQLVAAGHVASIVIPPWDSPEDAGSSETRGGIPIQQIRLSGGLPFTMRRLLSAIHDARPDIVHVVKPRAHAGMAQWWLWQRRQSLPFKIVLDVDDWEQAWNPVNRYPTLVAKFLTWQEEWGIRHAHGMTTASRWLEAKIARVAPGIPRYYLPNGVERPAQPVNSPRSLQSGNPRILFFSRFVEVEPEWLRAFWQKTTKLIPDAELVIAGTPIQPWLAEPFHAALAALPNVRWTGFVPADELPDLYAQTTCAIFPAMPVPLQQAKCSVRLATTLLHGVPVVASAVGEQSNYGADGAATLVSPDARAEEFAAAVAASIQNAAAFGAERRQATEQMLTRYAWSRLIAPLPAFYESLLAR
jgi:glycosyltransferase involved in cell wall biosynthesis